jgi:hypothetical protein
MAELKLDTSRERVAFIMDNIPQSRQNYLHLLLSYWQLFDGIDIPEDVVKQIVERGTQPETVARSRRKARELARYREILELQRWVQGLEEVEEPL